MVQLVRKGVPQGIGISSVVLQTKEKVSQFNELLDVSPELREKVSNKLAEKVVIDDLEYKYNVSGINIYEELEEFISVRHSTHSQKGYRSNVQQFLDWCDENGVLSLELSVKNVDNYQSYLSSKYSNGSIRTKLLNISSFYTFMLYRYPKVFKVNPFQKRVLPKNTLKFKHDFVTINDLKELEKEFKRIDRYDLITVIHLLEKYGFRVGIFEGMVIHPDGSWVSESKGQVYKGKFTKKELRDIEEYKVMELSRSTIINRIKKYTIKLFNDHKISCKFSVHDIRRYYISKNLRNCKNGEEIFKFSRTIHKNITTTMGYL